MEDAVSEDYKSSLADLNCNSKPHINMLTMLAEENLKYAPQIVQTITNHIQTVSAESKLPGLYLIDSIIKNVGQQYLNLFSSNIVTIFASVFEKVDERTRTLLYKLRQTWNEILPNKVLFAIDVQVKQVDPAWPITAQPPAQSIHINPKFLGTAGAQKSLEQPPLVQKEEARLKAKQNEVLKQLLAKQEQLRQLEQKKIEIAKLQKLTSENSTFSQPPPSQNRTFDPRAVAKLNPRLNQRDPRLQKTVSISIVKQSIGDESAVKSQQASLPPVSSAVGAKTIPVPPVLSVAKSEVKPENTLDNIKSKPKSIQGKNETLPESKKFSPKKNERTTTIKHTIDEANSEKAGLPKSEVSTSPSRSRHADDNRKRKLEDDWRNTDGKKQAGGNENLSPRKAHKELKKKETSPKGKKLVDSKENNEKSPVRITRSQSAAKKTTRQRSRSPLHKGNQKSEKSKSRNSQSPKGKKQNKNKIDERCSENSNLLCRDQEFDTDLRLLNCPSVAVDHTTKGAKLDSEESKENLNEDPEKKLREEPIDTPTDSLFGNEDQDYRQLSKNHKTPQHKGWAQYKALHPDEFKSPLRPARESMDNNQRNKEEENFKSDCETSRMFRKQESFDDSCPPAEYDRLGRPRLNRMKGNQRLDRLRGFYHRDQTFHRGQQYPDMVLSSVIKDPKDMIRQLEEMYRLGRISETDYHDIRRDLQRMWESEEFKNIEHHNRRQYRFRDIPPSNYIDHPASRNMPESMFHDHGFPPPQIPEKVQSFRNPLPSVREFKLDNKFRKVHFVDDRALVLMDNDEPKELLFKGEPTQVFIQGLKPITLRFDGQPVEFELDGKMYLMKFGAPSRELYVNNYPYEGKFGGPPFAAMLDYDRIYRIALGGPPPQVQVSEKPAYELYREFCTRNKLLGNIPIIPGKSIKSDDTVPQNKMSADSDMGQASVPYDVDMRQNSNVNKYDRPNFMQKNASDDMKDVDWRLIAPSDENTAQEVSNPNAREMYPDPSVEVHSNQWTNKPPHASFQHWDEDKTRSRVDGAFEQHKELEYQEEPLFRPHPPDMQDNVPHHPDWRTNNLRPPYQDSKMEGSPHQTQTPPQDPPMHPDQWDQSAHPQDFDHMEPDRLESGRKWRDNEFGPDVWRPPPKHQHLPQGHMYNKHRNSPQHNQEYPEYYEEFKGPAGHPPRGRGRPGFHPRHQRPAMRHRPPGPQFRPWVNRHELPPMQNVRHPMLLPPPRPPMHMRLPTAPLTRPVTQHIAPLLPNVEEGNVPPVTVPSATQALPPTQNEASAESQVDSNVLSTSSTEEAPIVLPSSLSIDVGTLFEKLLAAGIISKPVIEDTVIDTVSKESTEEKEAESDKEKDVNEEPYPFVDLKIEDLKMRHIGVTAILYKGAQCASCGMRFKEIHGKRYSQHLDWHFRVNRREKDGAKKAFSRKWYYDVEDWVQFEEFEDFEERARSFFELQADEEQFQISEPVEVPSVPASGQETEACVVCGEPFQLFWVEEEEEWHLRDAVRHDEQAYHPSCYEDFKKASEVPETPVEEPMSVDDDGKPKEIKEEVADEKPDSVAENSEEVVVEENVKDEKTIEIMEEVVAETPVTEENNTLNEQEEVVVKEEPEEERLEGKPGEEEIIGVITESDMENETEPEPRKESKMVVMTSGGIVMKVRAESIQPASPAPENTPEQDSSTKEPVEESEEEVFRPPTPDPRFQVLPPVKKGTELSGLCSIM